MGGAPSNPPVLFYDGNCGLCAASVRWVLRHERRPVLRFAPLQGEAYAALPQAEKPRDLGTVVLLDGDGLHTRSEAVLRVMRLTGGPWRALAAVGRVVPRPIREWVYGYVAARRIKWFGAADACVLPAPSHGDRFMK